VAVKGCRRPSGVSKSPRGDASIVGEFRRKILIQSLTRTSDSMGGASVAWTTFATAWARIEPRLGNERYFGQRLEENITHIITMRFVTGVTAAMRVSYGSRVFEIKSKVSPFEENQYLVLLCQEGVGT
jgi:SPP1 family predicted phage head-tail adaptor